MRLRSKLLSVAASLLLGMVAAVAVEAPAFAGNCSHPHSFIDGTGGYVTATNVYVRVGPHYPPGLSCAHVGGPLAQYGQAAQYHCYTNGDTYMGWSTWTWAYVPALNKSGWINDYLLVGNGSNFHC